MPLQAGYLVKKCHNLHLIKGEVQGKNTSII